ncbi:PrpF domain-containing protein [Pseudarthrobacter sulfonivorans]|uniref:PrpF domain-containing protein n=1 Tax=Pseudarthrobacter sulfonivorans TaxID=121292 RepID=UPI0027867532|nr:PrpF domain-containing protein [Pseudarthrobacter sulfonivorans]MDQ0000366.1 2-methylaconitate cis-trans-isomerase PrpF [Pseudarthrobacter sulfonivorans]
MKIEAEWMRGGTSKCWVFEAGHLNDSTSLDSLLPRVFGSPDSRQIDGVGGATSTTSKAMILHRPAEEDIDVDFTFAQVGIEEAAVDWGSNCGNCSAVVGLYAIEKGWVVPSGDVTRIVTRNTNTGQIIVQRVATPAGALPIVPDAQMPGVPFPGYRVGLGFQDPAGKTTGALLPSGSTTDTITAGGTRWTVSMVDAGAPVVIVRAEDLGLDAGRYDSWLAGVELQLETLEQIRRQAAVRMGLAATTASAARAIPKLAIASAPGPADTGGDLNVMMLSMGRPHPALAITGSIALTLAARTPGTVLHAITGHTLGATLTLRTPAGIIETWTEDQDGTLLVGVDRTARTIATTIIHLPEALGSAAEAHLAGATH